MRWYHKEIENPGMLGGILNHPQPGVFSSSDMKWDSDEFLNGAMG